MHFVRGRRGREDKLSLKNQEEGARV